MPLKGIPDSITPELLFALGKFIINNNNIIYIIVID
jgi:hypothetical protein